MTISILRLSQSGLLLSLNIPSASLPAILIDPPELSSEFEAMLSESSQPPYVLLTQYDPQIQKNALDRLIDLNATFVLNEKLSTWLHDHEPNAKTLTISEEEQIELSLGTLSSVPATEVYSLSGLATPVEANGFMLGILGHQLYVSGPTTMSPSLRDIGLNYRPNVSLLPVGPAYFNDQQLAQAMMWLGSDIALPLIQQDAQPEDIEAVFTAIDIYTPAICRILNPGDCYILQPTESSGRTSGPESRY